MGYKFLSVDENDGILDVRLRREADRNTFNLGLIGELTDFARAHRKSSSVHAIILRGAASFFSAGADMALLWSLDGSDGASGASLVERREIARAGPEMCQAWEDLQPITIAAIEGYCVGAAVALAACCDFRVVGVSASMSLPEVPLGINMGWHAIPRLVTLAGPSRTKRMAMFGRPVMSDKLLAWGLADERVADGETMKMARRWAKRVAALPPITVRMTKESVNAAANAHHHAATFMDSDQFLLTSMTEDFREGVAAFMEKRDPTFKGR